MKKIQMSAFAAFLSLVGIACAQSTAPLHEDKALESQLQTLAATHQGKVALYAENLKTGEFAALDADTPVQTASVIKLTILYEALEEVRAGKAHWDGKIVLQPTDKVPGSGILTFFDAPLTITLKDVLTMMVIMSDNTATNLAIDRFGLDNINNRIAWLGLKNTYLYKKVFRPATGPMPADQPQFGLGKTTPREMASVIEKIGRCQLEDHGTRFAEADKPICAVALHMLRNQFYRDGIPRYLEGMDTSEAGSAIANKTGSLNAVRNDVAIVASKAGSIIIASFTYDNADHGWTSDNAGDLMNAKLGRAIVQTWSPQGLDGSLLVPGLGLAGQN
jgi:beta-lactamase class A